MNISQPVASAIEGVEFSFLTSDDIKALSVKRITNPSTFDTLLNPVPGGLYDPALGPFLDNPCATCHLGKNGCPGHCGHIELPGPVYHPSFMDQLLRVLRAKCVYCHLLRLSRSDVNRYCCKLRLVGHGLLKEAADLEELDLVSRRKVTKDTGEDSETDEDDGIVSRRNAFVRRCIKAAGAMRRRTDWSQEKSEAVAAERRAITKDFLINSTKSKNCANCKGVSPSYRKDRFVKIFKKALGAREKAKMVQGGFKAHNPLVTLHRLQTKGRKRPQEEVDEGVADMDGTTPEDEEGDVEMLDAEMMGQGVVETDAGITKSAQKVVEPSQEYMSPGEVHAAVTQLFEKEQEIFSLVYRRKRRAKGETGINADMFFIKDVLVPPNRYRPEAKTGQDELAEAQQNSLYKSILTTCDVMSQIAREMKGQPPSSNMRARGYHDLQQAWTRLQDAVNSLIDRDRNPLQGAAGRRNEDGIKQKLEKKEGLFRKNMMGKRVNFAARSVISPDPNIETNEIGVPPVFAMKLTYPEPVTSHNFEELRQAVLNGPAKWPGAAAVEDENGGVINLRNKTTDERQALANQLLTPSSTSMNGTRNKKVHRHLNNGDVVIMNRQPTLHKPSLMAHRARVLPGEKTIRMHYANCNTYNADFDGDEMNMHFPQNELARAEALQIADTDHQYLSATAGKPLRGLIQDHVSMGLWLTNRDTLFDRDDYQQLLFSCLRPESGQLREPRILTVTPSILKPRPMWTGKQVITTILLNIQPISHPGIWLTSKSSTGAELWGTSTKSEEGTVIFQEGELLCGILDKKQIGPSAGGFVHAVYEAYGHDVAGQLLSIMGRLLTKLLHVRAFSCGVEDLVLTQSGERTRTETLQEADNIGIQVAAKYVTLEDKNPTSTDSELKSRLEEVLRDDSKQAGLDSVMNSRTKDLSSAIIKACLPAGLAKPFPKNQMQGMTNSGAKGSSVNANLISCNLGQQVLEGRRVPTMISGKTLPCFAPFESNIRAGGYITDRFLTGIRPQEYYFHAMAGREGLIDTAVKTSRSGYLQRCLIKGMEGLKVEYDTSVRDVDGTIVQFLYGEDGLDVTKQTYLSDFKFLAENFLSEFASLGIRDEFSKIQSEEAREHNRLALKKTKKTGDLAAMDTAISIYSPSRYAGASSEKFYADAKNYCDENPDRAIKSKKQKIEGRVSRAHFEALLDVKYLKSVIDAGEAVGVVAGQSVGEPSTQMTLNTFHLAGHSAKNVTLGIPRLREIVMTASASIATPTMTLYLNSEINEDDGKRFAKAISRLSLAEVLDKVTVTETVGKGLFYEDAKSYKIDLEFFPSSEYTEEYAITVQDVIRTIETKFLPRLQKITRKELKNKGDIKTLKSAAKADALPDVGQSSGSTDESRNRPEAEQEGGEDDMDDDGDDDATNAKQKANQNENTTYDAPDDEEEAAAGRGERDGTPDVEESEDETYGGSPPPDKKDVDSDEDGSYMSNAKEREARVKEKMSDVSTFAFDDATGSHCSITLEHSSSTAKLLMLALVEFAARDSVIQAIPGLSACTVVKEDDPFEPGRVGKKVPVVITEGQNLLAMRAYQDVINPHKILTNDIYAMLTLYGVESCRTTIMREMSNVFSGHGIAVDIRHLSLIADYMTRGGGYLPFNRNGLKGSTSPFMKMSFETTVNFLKDAVLEGDDDNLSSPSARLVVGRVAKVGTGACDVLMPVA